MAEAAAATTAPAPAKGGSTKLLLIILIVLLLVGMGGAAAWFFLGGGNHAASPAAPAKPKEPVFVPMDTLTVNLKPEEGNDRYLQIGITFKSAIVTTPGLKFAGTLPRPLEDREPFTAGVLKNAKEPAIAEAFVASLSGPEAAARTKMD